MAAANSNKQLDSFVALNFDGGKLSRSHLKKTAVVRNRIQSFLLTLPYSYTMRQKEIVKVIVSTGKAEKIKFNAWIYQIDSVAATNFKYVSHVSDTLYYISV